LTELEVEEADLSEDGGGSDGDGGRRRLLGAFVDFIVNVVRILFSEVVGYRVSRAKRRLRLLGVLALTFLVFGLLASVVWLLVGVAFLVERFPATADPLVFAAGGVVGYLVAVVAGIVYSG
jgi:hypothetical protein